MNFTRPGAAKVRAYWEPGKAALFPLTTQNSPTTPMLKSTTIGEKAGLVLSGTTQRIMGLMLLAAPHLRKALGQRLGGPGAQLARPCADASNATRKDARTAGDHSICQKTSAHFTVAPGAAITAALYPSRCRPSLRS